MDRKRSQSRATKWTKIVENPGPEMMKNRTKIGSEPRPEMGQKSVESPAHKCSKTRTQKTKKTGPKVSKNRAAIGTGMATLRSKKPGHM